MTQESEYREECTVWGGCPECDGYSGMATVNRVHWFVCDDHQTRWPIGIGMFHGGAEPPARFADYAVVEPSYPDPVDPVALITVQQRIARMAREMGEGMGHDPF